MRVVHEQFPSFESLDRLATTEMRPAASPSGIVGGFYRLVRGDSEEPLSRRTAREILARNGSALIVTGLVDAEKFPAGEVDGPVGAIALARALVRLGVTVTIITDREVIPALRELAEAAAVEHVTLVSADFSTDKSAYSYGSDFDIVISVEKLGRNSEGIRHLVWGTPVDVGDPYADEYVLGAAANGALTVAIGDNGNEIGFGKIAAIAESSGLAPPGVQCHGGFFSTTSVDHLFPAAVSNLGCYAICAGLAILTESPDVALSGRQVHSWTELALDCGLRSGGVENPRFRGDDGIPLRFVAAHAELIFGVVHQRLYG